MHSATFLDCLVCFRFIAGPFAGWLFSSPVISGLFSWPVKVFCSGRLFTRSGRCFIFGRKMLFKSGL
jgi:hypothetical protein